MADHHIFSMCGFVGFKSLLIKLYFIVLCVMTFTTMVCPRLQTHIPLKKYLWLFICLTNCIFHVRDSLHIYLTLFVNAKKKRLMIIYIFLFIIENTVVVSGQYSFHVKSSWNEYRIYDVLNSRLFLECLKKLVYSILDIFVVVK